MPTDPIIGIEDFEYLLVFIAILLFSAGLAKAGALPRFLPGLSKARPQPQKNAKGLQQAAQQMRAHYLGKKPLLPDLLQEIEACFPKDVLWEMRAAAQEEASLWKAFEDHFGPRPDHLTAEHHAFIDPIRVSSLVRHYRALDEALVRQGFSPAPKPSDWLTFYANGHVPLPPASWEKSTDSPPQNRKTQPGAEAAFSALLPALAPVLSQFKKNPQGEALAALTKALAYQVENMPELQGESLRAVPHHAGPHQNYTLPDWSWQRPYVHLFAHETIKDRLKADLLLSYGHKGHAFGYLAILCEDLGPGKDHSGREIQLQKAGYPCFRFDVKSLQQKPGQAAEALLVEVRAMLKKF